MENDLLRLLKDKLAEGKIAIGKSKVGDFYATLSDGELGLIMESIEAEDERKGDAVELMMFLFYLETGKNRKFTEKALVNAFELFLIITASEMNVRLGHMKRTGTADMAGKGASYSLTDKGEGHVLAMMGKDERTKTPHKTVQ